MSKVEVKAELLGRASRFAPLPGPHNSRTRTTPGPAPLPDPASGRSCRTSPPRRGGAGGSEGHGRPRRERRAAVEALLALLTADETVLRHTRNALGEYPEALPAVRRLIGHPSDKVRAAVVSLLDEDEDGDGRLLLGHLHDPSELVRYEAWWGISRYVNGYGALPRDAHGLLGEIEALAPATRSPRSPCLLNTPDRPTKHPLYVPVGPRSSKKQQHQTKNSA
ncbi:HEAT repeat domain-containing protein, partial [Streptomyces scabiei]|uniref:HEAT repeat domain-containing protein n=1 Tax=Streptomyces scabiei TaxID=1930 RepID=UPI0029B643E4